MKKKNTAFQSLLAWFTFSDVLNNPHLRVLHESRLRMKKIRKNIEDIIGKEAYEKALSEVTPEEIEQTKRACEELSKKPLPPHLLNANMPELTEMDEFKITMAILWDGVILRLTIVFFYAVFFYISFKVIEYLINA